MKSGRYFLGIILLSLVYFLAARWGLSLAVISKQVTAVWPPTGISIAALLLLGYRFIPGIVLGAFAANFSVNQDLLPAIIITAGNTLEAAAAVYLFKTRGEFDHRLLRLRDVLAFVVCCVVIAPLLSATCGALSLSLPRSAGQEFSDLWTVWWVGDSMGALIFAPFLLSLTNPAAREHIRRKSGEFLLFSALLLSSDFYIFSNNSPFAFSNSLAFIFFPFLMWAAARLNMISVTLVSVLAAVPAILATQLGRGPFGFGDPGEGLLALELFLGSMALAGLFIAAAIHERDRAVSTLKSQVKGLHDAAEKLTSSNAELERFAHIISHDLQEPLHSFKLSVQVFAEKYAEKLDADDSKIVDYLQASSTRLSLLVKGLTELSLAQNKALKRAPADLNSVFSAVRKDLEIQLNRSNVNVMCEKLPILDVDEIQIGRVFHNLLTNSIKFRNTSGEALIEIKARENPDEWIITVLDNGIGISTSDPSRLFDPFVREQKSAELPGTGMGLSICKKIVELHGGSISVHKREGGGTVVEFTLPKNTSRLENRAPGVSYIQ